MEIESLKQELQRLIEHGRNLLRTMLANANKKDDRPYQILDVRDYQSWYSPALLVVKQIIPERLKDFEELYTGPKRTRVIHATYGISDYFNGREFPTGAGSAIAVRDEHEGSFVLLFQHQLYILSSCEKLFDSRITKVRAIAKAELFDSEIQSARSLLKNGYGRPAGVLVGVVLESHLKDVCANHAVAVKKNPGINDFATALQSASVVDVIQWRRLQSLADIRNLCGHKRDREPKDDEVAELIDGVEKAVKTLI